MQVTLGRDWVLELSVELRRICSPRSLGQRRSKSFRVGDGLRTSDLRWERDKLAGQMLSGWFDDRQRHPNDRAR